MIGKHLRLLSQNIEVYSNFNKYIIQWWDGGATD